MPSNKKGGQGASGSGAGSSSSNNSHTHKQQPNFKVSEWGPETVDEIMQLKSVREQKSPYGGTMADIYDQTPKGSSLRFMIEDKVKFNIILISPLRTCYVVVQFLREKVTLLTVFLCLLPS